MPTRQVLRPSIIQQLNIVQEEEKEESVADQERRGSAINSKQSESSGVQEVSSLEDRAHDLRYYAPFLEMRRINQELEEKKRAEGVQSGPSELSANHANEIPELLQDSFQ